MAIFIAPLSLHPSSLIPYILQSLLSGLQMAVVSHHWWFSVTISVNKNYLLSSSCLCCHHLPHCQLQIPIPLVILVEEGFFDDTKILERFIPYRCRNLDCTGILECPSLTGIGSWWCRRATLGPFRYRIWAPRRLCGRWILNHRLQHQWPKGRTAAPLTPSSLVPIFCTRRFVGY